MVFLASDDAGFITGSTLSANGGQYWPERSGGRPQPPQVAEQARETLGGRRRAPGRPSAAASISHGSSSATVACSR